MLTTPVRDQVSRYLAYAGFGATIIISPWTNYDPVNIVKMVVIAVLSFIAFGHLLLLAKPIWANRPYRLIIALVAAFIAQMVFVMAVDDSPMTQQIYGTFGRNTGFITYLSFALLLLTGAIITGPRQGRKLTLALLYAGTFNAIYGYMQSQGVDPVPWSNPYSQIIGTLGNPNFTAAMLGFTSVVAAAILFGNGISQINRALAFALSVFSLYLAFLTGSTQGPAVALIGYTIIGYQYLAKTLNWKWARLPYLALVLISGIVAVLGTLQRGPLKGILYQDSVTYRGDYWRAGLKMTESSPITGVGLDSYGDYYRSSRTIFATERRGPDVISNSAHNVFLDISSSGGLPLLIIYLAIMAVAARSAYLLLARSAKYDWVAVSLVSAWVSYLAQSAISINQVGIAVWGWILPGAIIGLYTNRDLAETPARDKRGRRIYAPAKYLLTGVAMGVVAVLVVLWPLRYDSAFRYAYGSGNIDKIEEVVRTFPMNNAHIFLAVKKLTEMKEYDRAVALLRVALENNPRDFVALRGLIQFPTIVGEERAQILAKMRELDPNNTTIPIN